MKHFQGAIVLMLLLSSSLHAQDTSCGIVWYPAQRISITVGPGDNYEPRLAVQGDTVHCVWSSSEPLLYARSVDGGLTWQPPRNILTDTTRFRAYMIWPLVAKGDLFAFWREESGAGTRPLVVWMMKSTDRGTTWSSTMPTLDSLVVPFGPTAMGDTIAMSVADVRANRQIRCVLRSKDFGASWSLSNAAIRAGESPSLVFSGGKLHMVRRWGWGQQYEFVMWYQSSTDLGETWTDSVALSPLDGTRTLENVMTAGSFDNLHAGWRDTRLGCLTMVGCSIALRSSTNNGSTWMPDTLLTDEPRGLGPHVAVQGARVAVVWLHDLGITGHIALRLSYDYGKSWCPIIDLTPTAQGTETPWVAITSRTIVIAWMEYDGSDWHIHQRTGVFLPTTVADETAMAHSFELSQNYPNPFNAETEIRFTLVRSSFVTVNVYDLLGRKVSTLLNEWKESGFHAVRWDASALPSGLYFYRIHAGTQTAAGKALLLK